ncbi:PREDICTED: uncharacterized protein LOC104709375 [Camelina sativa]|uniref:Uncharacterized protein LOC104709375 n=1 Tax=Camelina sativa TaxID=90675 RepID=A0ABM0TCQ5_CAMSA|nr:PREDICTED: uncharacterized protein LOC104709375 [Camelina sativa]
MVATRVIRKPTRSKSSTSSAARKTSKSADVDDSPLNSPLIARSKASRAIISSGSPNPAPSPFSMHSANHPGLILIAIRLDGTNYDDWDATMRIALDSKRKLGFIDGSLPRPDESDSSFPLWSCCNNMVKSWLLNSVSPEIYRSILRMKDASDIWRDLYSRFHMSNLPRTFNITQEIQDLRQGSMSLMAYYTKLKTLWSTLETTEEINEPCICGKVDRLQQKAERAKIVKFLAGLNESYATIRRQIIMKKVLPSLAEVYKILDQDDSQKGFSNLNVAPSDFQVSEMDPFGLDPTICYVQNGPHKGRPICSFCNRVGHIAERCYKKHDFPPGFVSKNKNANKPVTPQPVAAQVTLANPNPPSVMSHSNSPTMENMIGNLSKDQLQQFIALFSSQLQTQGTQGSNEASSSSNPEYTSIDFSPSTYCFIGILTVAKTTVTPKTWVIDSGATHHVYHDRSLFSDMDTSIVSYVNFPTGSTVKISVVGSVRINSHITLQNDLTKELKIGKGRRVANLYVLDDEDLEVSANAVVDVSMWHRRLGHPAFSRLDVISQSLGTTRHKNKRVAYCHICHLAIQSKLSYPSPNNICNSKFELLHIDIWGPFSVDTIE